MYGKCLIVRVWYDDWELMLSLSVCLTLIPARPDVCASSSRKVLNCSASAPITLAALENLLPFFVSPAALKGCKRKRRGIASNLGKQSIRDMYVMNNELTDLVWPLGNIVCIQRF